MAQKATFLVNTLAATQEAFPNGNGLVGPVKKQKYSSAVAGINNVGSDQFEKVSKTTAYKSGMIPR